MQVIASPETRTVLDNVRWETFIELAEQRRGSIPRMTYDEGVVELTSPKRQHENIGRLIGRLVETFTEVMQIEIQSVASTTFKRKDLAKAFEADESYYIKHAELISSAIAKLKLFAAMGVPEVWRHDGEHLQMHYLHDGTYELTGSSKALPSLSAATIDSFLDRRFAIGETALIREFRESLAR